MSEEPEHRFEVVVPVQQPAEMLTQTPATPEAVQVSVYEQEPSVELPPLSAKSSSREEITATTWSRRKKREAKRAIELICGVNLGDAPSVANAALRLS